MGKMQRTKGASYEREVCNVIGAYLGIEVKRHIGQARDGGNDITVGPLVIECKRRKTLKTLRDWFDQAKAACRQRSEQHARRGEPIPRSVPVIVCREDNGESLVVITLHDFLALARPNLPSRQPDDPKPLRFGEQTELL